MEIDIRQVDETRRAIRLAALLVLILCVAGIAGIWAIDKLELWRRSMFYEQFATEGPGIAILAAGAIALLVLGARPVRSASAESPAWLTRIGYSRIGLAIAALVVVRVGAAVIFHDYPLVDDEYSGLFQATIYGSGHATATVAQPWCQWIGALTPTSILSTGCQWSLSYFPVNALIRGGFMAVHLDAFAHPAIVALTLLLVVDICRRLWPQEPERAALAAVFLAGSTQFLMMSMTAFSMPAHLLASTVWLWLYVRPERWALVILPWVGVIALGVHSPYPHVLFVTPFIFRYLVERRYRTFAYFSIVYVAGAIAWVTFLTSRGQPLAPDAAIASAQDIAGTARGILFTPHREPIYGALSIVVLALWNLPIAFACAVVALLMWRRLDVTTRWIAISLLFTLLIRATCFVNYGAGWGNRIVHAELTNFAILAAVGVSMIARSVGGRRIHQLVGASALAAVFIQLPLRGWEAARVVRPYERASAYLAALPADVVVVQFQSLQWGRQLLRNDPFLRDAPRVMDLSDLTPEQRDLLERSFPGRVRYVRPEEITALGVKRASRIGRFELR